MLVVKSSGCKRATRSSPCDPNQCTPLLDRQSAYIGPPYFSFLLLRETRLLGDEVQRHHPGVVFRDGLGLGWKLSYQPQRHREFVELEVGPQIRDSVIGAGLACNLTYFDPSLTQGELCFLLLTGQIVEQDT